MNAITDALATRTTMSSQALGSRRARDGLKDIPLGQATLCDVLHNMAPGAERGA